MELVTTFPCGFLSSSRIAYRPTSKKVNSFLKPRVNESALQHLTGIFQQRASHFNDELAATLGWSTNRERWIATRQLWLQALHAQRRELVHLRRTNQIDDELARQILFEIDLEESSLRNWAL